MNRNMTDFNMIAAQLPTYRLYPINSPVPSVCSGMGHYYRKHYKTEKLLGPVYPWHGLFTSTLGFPSPIHNYGIYSMYYCNSLDRLQPLAKMVFLSDCTLRYLNCNTICHCTIWRNKYHYYYFKRYSSPSHSGHSQQRPPSLIMPRIFAATTINVFTSPSHQEPPL